MEQELREVSEEIPLPLLLPHPESQLSHTGKWNHRAKTKPGRETSESPSTFIHMEILGTLLKVAPSTIFSASGLVTICYVNLKITHQLCHRKTVA